MDFQSCKPTFNRLKDEKKFNILSVSVREFSLNGFNSANINTIAEKSSVSIGAMYKYFENKRALYLTCVEWAMHHLTSKINDAINDESDMMMILRKIVSLIQDYRTENEAFTKLYYEMATESNAEFAMIISSQIEGVTADLYAAYIKAAQDNHQIRKNVDPRFFAFFIDNLLMMLQFSYSCEYYKDRMAIYTYEDVQTQDRKLAEQMLLFIEGALLYHE